MEAVRVRKAKECPFCGGSDIYAEIHEAGAKITCYDCLSEFFQAEVIDVHELVEAWNKRAKPKLYRKEKPVRAFPTGADLTDYMCGSCGTSGLTRQMKFCPECGRMIKW